VLSQDRFKAGKRLATRVIQSVTTHASTTRTLTPQTSVPHLRRLYRQQLPATAITTYVFLPCTRKCPVCLGEPIRMSARPFPRAISMPCRRVSGLFLGTTRGPEPGAREKGERLRLAGWSHTRTTQNFYTPRFISVVLPGCRRSPQLIIQTTKTRAVGMYEGKEDQRSEPATHSNASSRAVLAPSALITAEINQ
jgi:hypothetical protein